MSDNIGGDTIKVPDEPDDKGNLDVKSGPPSYIAPGGGDTIKSDSVKAAEKADPNKSNPSSAKSPSSTKQSPSSSNSNPATAGGTLKKAPSTKSRLDDVPEEAAAFIEDPARQLSSYILVKQIGKGGMGAVWKAWDKKLTRWVAIKFLLVSEDEDVARFQREAKLAARLRHPNIAPIYEVGEAPATQAGSSARHYLAMEYIDGTTMAGASNLPLPELLDIFMKVAQGIEAAHKAGVVHRDLKPANVMLTSDKWPYVMDFGLAKAIQAESSISVSGAVMGTPAYMPPEQAQGQLDDIDGQSDVYSLGATMYAVFCKKQPFTGQNPMEILMKVCKEEPIPMRTHNPEIPEQVEKIVLKAMAKEKSDRYASAQALADDLKRFLSNQEIEAKGPSSLKLVGKSVKRNVWPLIVGVIVLAAGGAIGFLVLHKPPPVVVPPIGKNPDPATLTPTITKDPPVEDVAGKLAAAWFKSWGNLAEALELDFWKPGDATLGARVNKHLLALKAEAPARDTEVKFWFNGQTSKADDALREIRSAEDKRGAAVKLVGWCDTALAAARGIDFLKRASEQIQKTRDAAAVVANYKGSFTLKILVWPFPEVTKLTTGGKEFALKQKATPLMIGGIEIGDIEVEVSHPQHGKKVVTIPASQLKDGRTYQITGNMKDAKLRTAELP